MINKNHIDPKIKRANIIIKVFSILLIALYALLTYINYKKFN